MATILKARGRMTKDLVTQFEVGQAVVLVADVDHRAEPGRWAGAVGGPPRVLHISPRLPGGPP